MGTAEEGEVGVMNPGRNVRDPVKTFRFNRVFTPAATQGLIRWPTPTGGQKERGGWVPSHVRRRAYPFVGHICRGEGEGEVELDGECR